MTRSDWIEIARLSLSALTLASAVIAYLAYRANVRKQNDDRIRERDKELLLQTQKSMEWAYAALTEDGKNNPPEADRLNWLTAARHLLRAKKLASKIENSTYRTLHDEIEEYWRHKFYLALSHESLRKWLYYADHKHPNWPENIEIDSALVVIDFSNWKNGVPDPTDEVDRDALIAAGALQGGPGTGVRDYIARFEEIKAERSKGKQPEPLAPEIE